MLYTILSVKAMARAEIRKQMWVIHCHMICFSDRLAALRKVCSRWMEEMLMMDIDSLTFKTEALHD